MRKRANEGNANVNRKITRNEKAKTLFYFIFCVARDLVCFHVAYTGFIDLVCDAFQTYLLSQLYVHSVFVKPVQVSDNT